jgi:hypothetical protein
MLFGETLSEDFDTTAVDRTIWRLNNAIVSNIHSIITAVKCGNTHSPDQSRIKKFSVVCHITHFWAIHLLLYTFIKVVISSLGLYYTPVIHCVVRLTTGPQPLPKRVLHRVRSSASSFNFHYLLFSLWSPSGCLWYSEHTIIFNPLKTKRICFI